MATYEEKQAAVAAILHTSERVIVAFSGGVDSSLLLHVAVDTLGSTRVLAVIGESPSVPARELQEAKWFAQTLGVPFRVLPCQELEDARYAANPPDRCYYCKTELFSRLVELARQEGDAMIVDGANADDLGDWRPGKRAAQERAVRSPLQEAGLTKAEIRAWSRALGLSTWDKPAKACLASRIPYGTPITREALAAVDAAETVLQDAGFPHVRVRYYGDTARIEVAPDDIPRLAQRDVREPILQHLHAIGFRYVTLDLDGYRTGSLNAVLTSHAPVTA